MSHLQFEDSEGVVWTVWDVDPAMAHRALTALPDAPQGEATPRTQTVSRVHETLSGGWLCFETQGHKRRLAPIPAHWERYQPADLERLCREAAIVAAREPR